MDTLTQLSLEVQQNLEGDWKNWYFDISCLLFFQVLRPLLRPIVRAKVEELQTYLVNNGLAPPLTSTLNLASCSLSLKGYAVAIHLELGPRQLLEVSLVF